MTAAKPALFTENIQHFLAISHWLKVHKSFCSNTGDQGFKAKSDALILTKV